MCLTISLNVPTAVQPGLLCFVVLHAVIQMTKPARACQTAPADDQCSLLKPILRTCHTDKPQGVPSALPRLLRRWPDYCYMQLTTCKSYFNYPSVLLTIDKFQHSVPCLLSSHNHTPTQQSKLFVCHAVHSLAGSARRFTSTNPPVI